MDRVAMISHFRNDQGRRLIDRVEHLTSKSYPGLRWIWVVADSEDRTRDILADWAGDHQDLDITIVDGGLTFILDRLERLSATFSMGLDQINEDDGWVMLHESDLTSPPSVVEDLLANGVEGMVAAWTTLTFHNGNKVFYDIWAFHADGERFTNGHPYHPKYVPDRPFQVDGVGSVWIAPAFPFVDGVRCERMATREICDKLREEYGLEIWVDPRVECQQPLDLWVPHDIRKNPT